MDSTFNYFSVKSVMTPKYLFMFNDNNILLYTFEKFALYINSRHMC